MNKHKRINYPPTRTSDEMLHLARLLGSRGESWASTKNRLRSDFKNGKKLGRKQMANLKKVHSGEKVPKRLMVKLASVPYDESVLRQSSLEKAAKASLNAVPAEGPYHENNGVNHVPLSLDVTVGDIVHHTIRQILEDDLPVKGDFSLISALAEIGERHGDTPLRNGIEFAPVLKEVLEAVHEHAFRVGRHSK